jgi:hypothetical protein
MSASSYLEAVARGFQYNEILAGRVLPGPALKSGHGKFVEHFVHHSVGGRRAAHYRCRETIRVKWNGFSSF